jgi:ArsR family transcriptional regulator
MEHTFSYEERAERLRAVADETRLRILRTLLAGEKCVLELGAALGLEQPTVSHHLGLLRRARLVTARREGKRVVYAVSPEVRPVDGDESSLDLGCCRISFRPLAGEAR